MSISQKTKGKGNHQERDEWETPRIILDPLRKQYNIEIDCCASLQNFKFLTWGDDFLNYQGNDMGIHWMNPPFSKAKQMFKQFFKIIKRGIAIYRCDNLETELWQKIILPKSDWIFIPNKRTEYKGLSNKWDRPVFASALIGIGVDPIKNIDGITMMKSKDHLVKK